MKVEEFVSFWNEYTKNLQGNIVLSQKFENKMDVVFELSEIVSRSSNSTKTKLQLEYMPEPFLGDIQGEDIQWLFLSLNPGPVNEKQRISNGDWFQWIQRESYYDFAKANIYNKIPGNMWFDTRRVKNTREWARELGYNEEPSIKNIGNIELIPFHSHNFDELPQELTASPTTRDVFDLYWKVITDIVRRQKQKVHLVVTTPKWLDMLLRYYANEIGLGDYNSINLWKLIKTEGNKYAKDIIDVSEKLCIHIWPRTVMMNFPKTENLVPIEELIKPEYWSTYQKFQQVLCDEWRHRLSI